MNISPEILDDYVQGYLEPDLKAHLDKLKAKDRTLEEQIDLHRICIEGLEIHGSEMFRLTVLSVEETLDQEGFFSTGEEIDLIKGIELVGEQNFIQTVQEVIKGANSNQDINLINRAKKKNSGRIIGLSSKFMLAIAAALTILLTAVFWLYSPRPAGGPELFSEYYVTIQEDIGEQVKAEINEIGFTESDNEPLRRLSEALTLFSEEKYADFYLASGSLVNVDVLSHYREQIRLYQIISLIEMNRYHEALSLAEAIDNPNEEVIWYKVMILLKLDMTEEAEKLLANTQFNNDLFIQTSQDLFDKLRSVDSSK